MSGYTGTIYLFGIFPIYRGLYAVDKWQFSKWKNGCRWFVRITTTIRWKEKD
jgi:hypothetical protein